MSPSSTAAVAPPQSTGTNRTPLRALIVDDSADDAELLLRELRRVGYAVESIRVDNAEDTLAAITNREWDVVLSDFGMPGFDGLHALAIVQASGLDLPFIIISGTIGEETAVEALKAGAHDFLVKGKLARLQPAIDRELREAQTRRSHRRSETSLRESETRYRRIVETAQEGIWVIDANLRTAYLNRRMAELLGSSPAALLNVSLLDFLEPESEKSAKNLLTANDGRHHELKLKRHDGGELWVSLASTPASPMEPEADAPTGYLLLVTDVTEQRKLQLQLMVSDRMASVGLLAAGVAHEINNPLAAVLANVELAKSYLARLPAGHGLDLSELTDELNDAHDAAHRVRQIVRDLRIFSRSEQEVTGPVELAPTIESTLRMAWNEIRHRATLIKDLMPVPAVEGNESRLGQVFLNLIVNAAQAIPEGHTESNQIRIRLFQREDRRIEVSISDTGSGMPPEVQKRLFTPFFTTKPPGVGTGLGLSICMKIGTAMGGTIEVDSQVGRGTTFHVLLQPARNVAVPVPAPSPVSNRPVRRGRILVVDDEPMIGTILRRILASRHEVEVTQRARVAADRIRSGERFDIILCDLMMPEMTGMELYETLAGVAPAQAQAMVFLTGGAFTPSAQAFFERVENRRLDKPFQVEQVQNLIDERLRSTPAAQAGLT